MATLHDILQSNFVALIGSSNENDVVFTDPETSPRHCQITKIDAGKYLIVDLNSATGTYVNNKKIDKEFISESDFITVGSTIFQIKKRTHANSEVKIDKPEAPEPEQKVIQDPMPPPFVHERETRNAEDLMDNRSGEKSFSGDNKNSIKVYFLSAPEDEHMSRAIDKHLSTIRFSAPRPIEILGDFKMLAGDDVSKYSEQLFTADIVLAFISVDFLNNDNCYARIKKVIANHNNRKTILLPILARNCMWKATPFASLPLLPKNHQPLNNKQFWNSEDDALTEVVNDIYNSINQFTKQPSPDRPHEPQIVLPKLQVDWRNNYLWIVFWKRVAASLIDGVIIGVPLFIFFFVAIFSSLQNDNDYYNYGTPSAATAASTIFYYIIMVVIQIVIYAIMESSSWRGTPGKKIMKLQITDNAGNPISFSKSVIRNIIKLLISAFAGVGGGILFFLYMIAQIISYAKTKKFFHDQLSNTIIGERLTNTVITGR